MAEMLSVFSHAYWPFGYLVVCPHPLLFKKLSCFSHYTVVQILNLFWIEVLFQIYILRIFSPALLFTFLFS